MRGRKRVEKTKEWGDLIRDNLRMARRNAGYTQKEASRILGYSCSAIGNLEGGRKIFPRFAFFFKMCELYGVTPEEMFHGRTEPKKREEKN